jgi:hypothetical protein
MPLQAPQTGAPFLRGDRRSKTSHHSGTCAAPASDEQDQEKGKRIRPGHPGREHETESRVKVREIARKLTRLASRIAQPYDDTRQEHHKQNYGRSLRPCLGL